MNVELRRGHERENLGHLLRVGSLLKDGGHAVSVAQQRLN